MNYIKNNIFSIIIIVMLLVLAFGGKSPVFGAALPANVTNITSANPWIMASTTITGFKAGQNGTKFTRVNAGTCYLQPYATTIAASSTATVDCQGFGAVGSIAPAAASTSPLQGVALGDVIFATLATSTSASTTAPGLTILAASASTTAGYITLRIYNGVGALFTWATNAGTNAAATGTASYFVAAP